MNKRTEGKYKSEVTTIDFYEKYSTDTFKHLKEGSLRSKIDRTFPYYMDKVKFTEVLKDLMTEIKNLLIYEGFKWRLPGRIGELAILKRKVLFRVNSRGELLTKMPVNWNATNQLFEKGINKTAYHLNEHSEGYVMALKLNKLRNIAQVPYYGIYKFTGCRAFNRELGTAIQNNNYSDFYEYVKR